MQAIDQLGLAQAERHRQVVDVELLVQCRHGIHATVLHTQRIVTSIGKFTVEYDSDEGVRKYEFFHDRESAREFYDNNVEKNPAIRSTHLEDVFLEKTGRLDVRSIEGVLDVSD